MGNLFDVPINEFILKLADELKNTEAVKPLEWAQFCKTGMHKERPPVQNDWWYVRAAAILRSIKIKGPMGTQKLRVKYGGRKNRGYRPEHFFKGSGSIIRKILQQLEKAGLVVSGEKGVHKGRITTPAGDKLLNKVAITMMKELNITIPKRPDDELKITNVVKKKKKRKTTKRKKAVRRKTAKTAVKVEPKQKIAEKKSEPKQKTVEKKLELKDVSESVKIKELKQEELPVDVQEPKQEEASAKSQEESKE